MRGRDRKNELVAQLWPGIQSRIGDLAAPAGAGGTSTYAPSPHDLDSTHHSGTLDPAQYPDGLLIDGSRTLTGNLSVAAGATIDGVDVSVLDANFTAHDGGTAYAQHAGGVGTHTHQSAGAEGGKLDHGLALTGLTDDDHTIYLKEKGSGGTAAETPLHAHTGTAECGQLDHGLALTGLGDDDHTLYAVTPGTLTVATTNQRNASGAHYHAITSSANPGAAAALLASSAAGLLQIVGLGLGHAASAGALAIEGTATPQLAVYYDGARYATLALTSAGTLTVAVHTNNLALLPDGDIILDPGGNDVLPGAGYETNLGSLTTKYLTLHCAELWVETLVAQNTIATIGGRILVGPTTILTSDVPETGAQTLIYVKHNQMAVNDIVYLEANGKVEFMKVFSGPTGSGPYQYIVTRDLDGSGANAWYAGDAVFNTGTTGDGFIDLYSIAAVSGPTKYGPTIVGNVRNSATYNDWTEHWAIGNLNGLYGYGVDTYGAALGKYSGSTSYLTADATNGIRMMRGSTTLAQWDVSGNILIGQTGAGQDNVYISAGALAIRNNATERIGLTAAGVLTIKDAGGAAVFTFDASAGAEFTKPLTIGSAGGIYQGTGTFGSPTTGLKVWHDAGIGRIAGYNGGALQWYGGTDGRLYAGAGSVLLDANGVAITASTAWPPSAARAITWTYPGDTIQIGGYDYTGPNFEIDVLCASYDRNVYLQAGKSTADNSYDSVLLLHSSTSAAGSYAQLIVHDTYELTQLYGYGKESHDFRVGGGLYVGGTGTDPPAGCVVATGNFYGVSTDIANDNVVSFTPGRTIGAILVTSRNTAYADCWGMAIYRTAATHYTVKMMGSSIFDVATGALTGTTGTAGHVTVSANSADGKIYIENRRGMTISVHYMLFGT